MPTIPSAARHTAALGFHNAAVHEMGKGFLKGTVKHGARNYEVVIWSLDSQLPALVPGGLDLKERLQFSILKKDLRTAIPEGETVIYVEMKRAYVIDRLLDETTDATSWRYEARRAPGSDPA